MKTHTHHTHVSRRGSLILTGLIAALCATIPSLAKDPPAPQTVQVSGTVEVQGVVQTTDDSMNEPYAKYLSRNVSAGVSDSVIFEFPVPEGKRLIVETISFYQTSSSSQPRYAFARIRNAGVDTDIILPSQQIISYTGGAAHMAFYSTKLRVDYDPVLKGLVLIFSPDGSDSIMNASVTGYLVSL